MSNTVKRNKLITNVIFTVVIVAMLAMVAYFVVMQAQDKVPLVAGYGVLRVLTPSMEDTLMRGDYILIKKVSADQIQPDDIITYYSDDPSIKGYANTHRVTANEQGVWTAEVDGEQVFYTKGDNNALADLFPARESTLVGRYVCTMPWLSKTVDAVFGTPLLFVLIMIPMILYVFLYWRRLKLLQAREAEEKRVHEIQMEALVQLEIERLKAKGISSEDLQAKEQDKTE